MGNCSQHDKCFGQDVIETLCLSDTCGAYHSLSPLLHQLGIFSSYNCYTELISYLIKQQYEVCSSRPNLLVVGFASKESARALLDIPATSNIEVTFLDRCPTPVTQARKEFNNRDNLNFVNADILKFNVDTRYSLILTDSFLRQFKVREKRNVIRHLSHLLASSGKVVFREYVGANNSDLASFLSSIDNNPALLAWRKRANTGCKALFDRLLPMLKEYMSNVGGSYMSWELLFNDIKDAHLKIDKASVFHEKYGIVICGK